MKKMIPFRSRPHICFAVMGLLLLAGFALPGRADDYPLPDWATAHVSSAMCRGSKIHLVATGDVAVAYARVYAVLMDPKILEKVASAYRRELPSGAKTNLVVTPLDTNGHYLVDWNNERADVRDLWRGTDTNNYFQGGYVMTGKRFFGSFETVMNVRVQRTKTGQATFRADVLIYPHNGLIRFIFNNFISVESYFRNTMTGLSAEIKRICTNLCLTDNTPAAAGRGSIIPSAWTNDWMRDGASRNVSPWQVKSSTPV